MNLKAIETSSCVSSLSTISFPTCTWIKTDCCKGQTQLSDHTTDLSFDVPTSLHMKLPWVWLEQ